MPARRASSPILNTGASDGTASRLLYESLRTLDKDYNICYDTSRQAPRKRDQTCKDASYLTRARGLILLAATLSFGLSVGLYFFGDQQDGIFVGLWVPSILALGAMLVPRSTGGK